MSLKSLFSFLIIGAGGIGPLAYIVEKKMRDTGQKADLTDEKIWDCSVKQFDTQNLKHVIPNAPFFKKIHCFKEGEYDWQIFIPKAFINSIKLDETKTLNLVTASKTDNLKLMKIIQEETPLFKDWLLLQKNDSHNIEGRQGEDNRYAQLFEFQVINYIEKGQKVWVLE